MSFVLSLDEARFSATRIFDKFEIPIHEVTSNFPDMDKVLKENKNVLWQCTRCFPICDFIIVCPRSEDAETIHHKVNMLREIEWIDKSIVCDDPERPLATLIMGQLTITGKKHKKVDKKLCSGSPPSAIPTKKKEDKAGPTKQIVQFFLSACQRLKANPCVNFIWITERYGVTRQYQKNSIVCSSYKVFPTEIMDQLSIRSSLKLDSVPQIKSKRTTSKPRPPPSKSEKLNTPQGVASARTTS